MHFHHALNWLVELTFIEIIFLMYVIGGVSIHSKLVRKARAKPGHKNKNINAIV